MSAFAIALWPVFLIVIGARALQAAASCVLGPAIAAISLGLVGHAGAGRTDRPQRALCVDRQRRRRRRHGSLRLSAVEPGGLPADRRPGACRRCSRSRRSRTSDLALPSRRERNRRPRCRRRRRRYLRSLLCNRRLMIFAACVVLFQLANAAMLPLMGSIMTMRASEWATMSDRGLHRGAAAGGGAVLALGRAAGADRGAPAAAARRVSPRWRSAARCSRW